MNRSKEITWRNVGKQKLADPGATLVIEVLSTLITVDEVVYDFRITGRAESMTDGERTEEWRRAEDRKADPGANAS